MRLSLDTTAALVPRLPALSLDSIRATGGRKHVEPRQRFLAHATEAAYSGYRRHKTAPGASYFHSRALDAGLQTGKSGATATKLLTPFFSFPEGRTGFHAGHRIAKPYRLREAPAGALDVVLGGDVCLDAYLEDAAGHRKEFDSLPACGMPAELAGTFPVPKVFPLSMAAVDGALTTVEAWADADGWDAVADPSKAAGALTLYEARRMLRACRAWTRSVGGLPSLYRVESNGRLGGIGLSVVSLPRVLRGLLLAGSGLRDYDLEASNWRLYASAARACGFPTPAADEYLANRKRHHRAWTAAAGQREATVKAVPLSWLTGATLSAHPDCAAVQVMGAESFRTLAALPFVREFYKETAATMPRLCAEVLPEVADGGRRVYVNAVGAVLAPEKRGADLKDGQKASHLLTGLEQVAMQVIGPHVRGLAAVVFDGLLAPAQGVAHWPGIIRDESAAVLGFPLDVTFAVKPFEVPERQL